MPFGKHARWLIQNLSELLGAPVSPSLRKLRRDAMRIFEAALGAVNAGDAVKRWVKRRGSTVSVGDQRLDLRSVGAVRIISFGKASVPMARALATIVEPHEALVVVDSWVKDVEGPYEVIRGGHPEPDEGSLKAGRLAMDMARRCSSSDLLLVLVSGGGSAMLEDSNLSLGSLQMVSRLANQRGMDIRGLNTVRKHLSNLKGGHLARMASLKGAKVITLALSDVVGDSLSFIASGPTVPDETTYADTVTVLERYGLWQEVPEEVRHRVQAGIRGDVPETPKPSDPAFEGVHGFVIANNRSAGEAAVSEAEKLGYESLQITSELIGESSHAGRMIASIGVSVEEDGTPVGRPGALVSGGETTVTVTGLGTGGRNQELALAAVSILRGREIVLLSCGTDGRDGGTDAAGAVVDGETYARAQELGMDPHHYLKRNDSGTFFRRLKDSVITGPTGTNVMDLQITLVGPKDQTPAERRNF